MESLLLGYAVIAGSTSIMYLFVVLAIRFFGKTEIAQLSVIDLVFIMLLGNAVQNAMVGNNTSIDGGLVAATTLFIMNRLFKKFDFDHPHIFERFEGGPLVLIKDGHTYDKNIARAMITNQELLETLREHGVKGPKDADLVILEGDGNISVLQKQESANPSEAYVKKDVPRRDTKKD